jgi:putative transposase
MNTGIKLSMYSYRFRLYPNQAQATLLAKHFGAVRYLYNHFLTKRKEAYLNDKTSLNYYDNANELTTMKKSLLWLKEVGSQSLQFSLKCLDGAYNTFFRKLGGFPRYKSKHNHQSFRVPQSVKVSDDKLYIPKFLEGIKMVKHREVEGTIKFATISKNRAGQYHVSITVEREIPELPKNDNVVGIDLGIKTLAVCSDGTKYENIKPYKTLSHRMKMLQRRVNKNKKKGSKGRERARRKLAKIHLKIKNIRNDHLHKMTRKIINENQVIILENLAVQNMMKNHCLAGAIADASWYETTRQLEYKAKWYGRGIIRLDRWFPSSKTCEGCGWINQGLKLSHREWVCQSCGEVHDRDLNAARMIRKQGLRQLRVERPEDKRMDSGTLAELSVG